MGKINQDSNERFDWSFGFLQQQKCQINGKF